MRILAQRRWNRRVQHPYCDLEAAICQSTLPIRLPTTSSKTEITTYELPPTKPTNPQTLAAAAITTTSRKSPRNYQRARRGHPRGTPPGGARARAGTAPGRAPPPRAGARRRTGTKPPARSRRRLALPMGLRLRLRRRRSRGLPRRRRAPHRRASPFRAHLICSLTPTLPKSSSPSPPPPPPCPSQTDPLLRQRSSELRRRRCPGPSLQLRLRLPLPAGATDQQLSVGLEMEMDAPRVLVYFNPFFLVFLRRYSTDVGSHCQSRQNKPWALAVSLGQICGRISHFFSHLASFRLLSA